MTYEPKHNDRFAQVRLHFGDSGVIIFNAILWVLDPGLVEVAQYGQNLPSITCVIDEYAFEVSTEQRILWITRKAK